MQIVQKTHQEAWDQLIIRNREDDVSGTQAIAYELLKHLISVERDTAQINVSNEKNSKFL
jgi:hypothetical protein